MDFGEKLQVLRKDNGMSQEALAEKLNVSRQAISKWELGTASPDTDNIVLICKYFQVPIEYMLLSEFSNIDEYNEDRNSVVPLDSGTNGNKEKQEGIFMPLIVTIIGASLTIMSVFICYPYQLQSLRVLGEAHNDPLKYLFSMPIILLFIAGIAITVVGIILLVRSRSRGCR